MKIKYKTKNKEEKVLHREAKRGERMPWGKKLLN